jgi:SAM-dependent methyltransferase
MNHKEQVLLKRAAPYLRPPSNHPGSVEIRDDVVDLMGSGPVRRRGQKSLDRRPWAWLYDRSRERILPALAGLPSFETEVARLREGLALVPGDVVLDLACGHGNFTVALAESVGPDGLVIGVDISRAMLARAARRIHQRRLENVLLVWADAHDLPIADHSLTKLNCSGGFHGMPDLPRALAELARVSRPGARLLASALAAGSHEPRPRLKAWADRHLGVHFVPLEWLGRELAAVGFGDYESRMAGAWLGYAAGRMGGAR